MSKFLITKQKFRKTWEETEALKNAINQIEPIIIKYRSENFINFSEPIPLVTDFLVYPNEVNSFFPFSFKLPDVIFKDLSEQDLSDIELFPLFYVSVKVPPLTQYSYLTNGDFYREHFLGWFWEKLGSDMRLRFFANLFMENDLTSETYYGYLNLYILRNSNRRFYNV